MSISLTDDQVDSITATLLNRANAAIDNTEAGKSIAGYFTGNNDTVESSAGALRNTVSQITGTFQPLGHTLAAAYAAGDAQNANGTDLDTAIRRWVSLGQTYVTSINEIDGYGNDASLDAVLQQTASATATQTVQLAKQGVAAAASLLPWYVWPLAIGVVVLMLFPSLILGRARD